MTPGQFWPTGQNWELPDKTIRAVQDRVADSQVPGEFEDDLLAVFGSFFVSQNVLADESACLPISQDFFALDPLLAEKKRLFDFVAQLRVI